jgi:hypothetical protein
MMPASRNRHQSTLSNTTPTSGSTNLAAFVKPDGFRAGRPYRFGTSGRNTVIGPGIVALDGALLKSFHFTKTSWAGLPV